MEINLTAPTSWNELNPEQLTWISWLMCQDSLTAPEFLTYAFVRLSGITILKKVDDVWYCKRGKDSFSLTAEQVLSFSKQFSRLASGMEEITPVPKIGNIRHQDVRLRGLPFSQYLACENYYQAFLFTKKEEFLNCLIASFYLGNKRFDDGKTLKRSRKFAKLPFHVRHTVFLWFYGLKSVFQENFPSIFQKIETILEDEKPQAPNMRIQINNMIRALTGGDVTKTDIVFQTETWTALAELDAKARESKELERRMKKIK
ncbi:MAG: hypothetical protein LBK58_04290 [Prevotellaceae bacterium]|jgi:hypothetical protein|nr:hypothetical protein [Prevotellaceae bacterium]